MYRTGVTGLKLDHGCRSWKKNGDEGRYELYIYGGWLLGKKPIEFAGYGILYVYSWGYS
jgi:hypothetical protein